MEELLECSVCLDGFQANGPKAPKVLPCQHSFCLECLKNVGNGFSITCPTCRSRHYTRRPDELPNSFLLLQLMDRRTAGEDFKKCQECFHESGGTRVLCDRCFEGIIEEKVIEAICATTRVVGETRSSKETRSIGTQCDAGMDVTAPMAHQDTRRLHMKRLKNLGAALTFIVVPYIIWYICKTGSRHLMLVLGDLQELIPETPTKVQNMPVEPTEHSETRNSLQQWLLEMLSDLWCYVQTAPSALSNWTFFMCSAIAGHLSNAYNMTSSTLGPIFADTYITYTWRLCLQRACCYSLGVQWIAFNHSSSPGSNSQRAIVFVEHASFPGIGCICCSLLHMQYRYLGYEQCTVHHVRYIPFCFYCFVLYVYICIRYVPCSRPGSMELQSICHRPDS